MRADHKNLTANISPQSLRVHRVVFIFLLFADPGGIGSAFHRAKDGEKQNAITLRGFCRLPELSCNIYYAR